MKRSGSFPVSLAVPLNAATLFAAWESALPQHPVRRALTLLAATWPERSAEEWARVTIGERDGCLLRLREELFGSELEAMTVCPKCGERLQLAFSTQAIRTETLVASQDDRALQVEAEGYEVNCRLPTSIDLLEIASSADSVASGTLLKRCVSVARRDGAVIDTAGLPDQIVKTVVEKMALADPQAEVQIELTCPACRHGWSTLFDILSYLWSEIDDWAQHLLMEVHALASAYGWSERDIISMSARRRRLYLEMVGS